MKGWKVILGLLATWLCIMLYMSTSLLGVGDGSARVERQLRKALEELDLLHSQNVELQHLAQELKHLQNYGMEGQGDAIQHLQERLQKATEELDKLTAIQSIQNPAVKNIDKESTVYKNPSKQNLYPLSMERETARRKTENTVTELWYYLNSRIKELGVAVKEDSPLKNLVVNLQNNLKEYKSVMMDDFYSLRTVDDDEKWRDTESEKLGRLVQKRLEFLQNPQDCQKAKLVVCDLHKGCGFGCQLHHVSYCLLVAYATQRTLVLQSKGWRYASKGWETIFQPLSQTCNDASGPVMQWGAAQNQMNEARIVQMPIVDSLHPRPDFMPQAIPEDLAPRLMSFHGDPPVWWIGQLVRYLVRPQKFLQDDIDTASKNMGFEKPIVGVHIRRTDKVGVEAAYHSLDEYMDHVDAYFEQRERREKIAKRRIYLATDDPSVLTEAKAKYPNYLFVSDNDISRSASLGSRYSDSSLRGIVLDIHFLSHTDYLVCTFSSQVCRVAYELMQTLHGDASQYFRSLDDVFYFGGQNQHSMRAIEPHQPQHKDEVAMEVGDLLGIAGNHWDGYSKGLNRKTGQSGLYPSFKVVNEIVTVKLPVYPEVKEEEEKVDSKDSAFVGEKGLR